VAQGVDPEFKPQCCRKKKKKELSNHRDSSRIEPLPSMYKGMSSTPSTATQIKLK
jgi:hypothetical protein